MPDIGYTRREIQTADFDSTRNEATEETKQILFDTLRELENFTIGKLTEYYGEERAMEVVEKMFSEFINHEF